jgi:hypothetical protein
MQGLRVTDRGGRTMSDRRLVCSHCGQPIRCGVPLTPLKARLFDAIERAGADGIETGDLVSLFDNRQHPMHPATLKAHVNQINALIKAKGFVIRGRWTWRLSQTGATAP